MSETTIQVFEIYIKAPAQKVWDAITDPAWTARYGYKVPMEYDLRPGGAFRSRATKEMVAMGLPEIIIDGEVIEADPPHRLTTTYRFLFNDGNRAEGFSRITWEVEATTGGFTRLTVSHDVTGKPIMAGMVSHKFQQPGGGGWSWILSDLKSLMETGETM
ncbi:SRPBCC domain-containing protein [Phenylobacterium montanum]|uniref:SRPBCC domain-containing protein n=1 Tax=Phenylobacterium montanum TaxID=2823693 RepID=A0A975FZM8_9CAUL|nr:SRPBCC domain-containing protein [Caulobacter sp. S6]QUD87803.1 SRPBCC domain-containing protein [Caulobacter sp. S6]